MSVNMKVFRTRRAGPALPRSCQGRSSATSSRMIAAVGQENAAARRTSSSTLSAPTTSLLPKSPASQSKAVGARVMQLPAPMHLWRSTRARMAISATRPWRARGTPARSPRRGSTCRAGRAAASGAGDLVLGEVELGSDLGVRPALGQELQQPALGIVQAAAIGVARDPARSAVAVGSGGPSGRQLDELAPDRPGRATGRGSFSSAVPCAILRQRGLEVAADELLHLGRPPAKMARAAGMTISRLASSWSPAWRAWRAAPPPSPRPRRRRARGRPSPARRRPARPTARARAGAAAAPSPAPPTARRAPPAPGPVRLAGSERTATNPASIGETGEGLAPRGRPAPLGRHRDGALEVPRMPSASPAPARAIPRHVSSWRTGVGDGAIEAAAAARPIHRSAPSMSPSSSRLIATPPAARNSMDRSPWSLAAR